MREHYLCKMRITSLFFMLIALLLATSCGQNEIQLPDQVLSGKIGGEDWEYKFANGFLVSSDLKYRIQFLSTEELATDPCSVPSTGNRFISMEIPYQLISRSIPFPIIEESPKFHITISNEVIASSGFLEIFDISGPRILGYMEASVDDENVVSGSFEAIICD